MSIPRFNPTAPVFEHLGHFPYFLEALWWEIGRRRTGPNGPEPMLSEDDLDIAAFADARDIPKRIILAPRGKGKTDQVTTAYALYRLRENPETRILIVSKTHGHAKGIVSQLREWIESVWFLEHLRPSPDKQMRHRDKEDQFDVGLIRRTKTPSVLGLGIDGQITGKRAHLVIADDIETLENTKTVNARESLRQQRREFTQVATFTDRDDQTFGEILVVGTPHHEESIYDDMVAHGYERRVWTIMLPPRNGDYARTKIDDLAPYITGRIDDYEDIHGPIEDGTIVPTDPARFPVEVVVHRQAEGALNFAMQSMCISRIGQDFQSLRLGDLIVPDFDFRDGMVPWTIKWGEKDSDDLSTIREDIERIGLGAPPLRRQMMTSDRNEWSRLVDVRMRVDPSGGGEDENAWGIAGAMGGYVWVLLLEGAGGSNDDTHGSDESIMRRQCEQAREFGVRRIVVEGTGNMDTYAMMLRELVTHYFIEPGDEKYPMHPQGWRCSVESSKTTRAHGQKAVRIINTLGPVMARHRLIVHADALRPTQGLPRHHELQYQLSAIKPFANAIPHDDRADVLASLVADFDRSIEVDPEERAGRMRESAVEAFLGKVRALKSAMRRRPDAPRWFEHQR